MDRKESDSESSSPDGDYQQGPMFLVGHCASCESEVLTGRQLDDDQLVDACVHCDRRIRRSKLKSVSSRAIVDMGYAIEGREDDECDTHGGCRGGTCGVRQPGSN